MGQLTGALEALNVFKALKAFAQPLLPPACALCRAVVIAPLTLCPQCWAEVAFLEGAGCVTCGHPVPGAEEDPARCCESCHRYPPSWDRGRAAVHYDGGGRRLVLGLKHADRVETLPLLGGWMARAGADLLGEADVVVPIPLHWQRRLKRRGNQAAGLALAACRAAGCSSAFAPRALIRPRATPNQGGRNREARRANVAGAFAPGPEAGRMAGRRVLLVDDVLTTGASLSSAAGACRDAGAAGVDVLVLALVVRGDASYIAFPTEDEDHEAS